MNLDKTDSSLMISLDIENDDESLCVVTMSEVYLAYLEYTRKRKNDKNFFLFLCFGFKILLTKRNHVVA